MDSEKNEALKKAVMKIIADNPALGVGETAEKVLDLWIEKTGAAIDLGASADVFIDAYIRISKEVEEQRREELKAEETRVLREELTSAVNTLQEDPDKADTAMEKIRSLMAKESRDIDRLPVPGDFQSIFEPDPPGFTAKILGGTKFFPGSLAVISARPKVGKTTLMLNIAREMLEQGRVVRFYSYEERSKELFRKLIISEAASLDPKFTDSGYQGEAWKGYDDPYSFMAYSSRDRAVPGFLRSATEIVRVWVNSGQLVLFDQGSGNYLDLSTQIERDPGEITFVDYIQKIPGPNRDTRQLSIQEISGELVRAAIRTGTPIVTGAQVKRTGGQGEAYQMPQPENFRESGDIEQDLNVALGVCIEEDSNPARRELKVQRILSRTQGVSSPFFLTHTAPMWHLGLSDGPEEKGAVQDNNMDSNGNERVKTGKVREMDFV